MLGLVSAKLLERDVSVGGRAGFVVEAAVFSHLGPILVVELLNFSAAFPLIGEVHEGVLQVVV